MKLSQNTPSDELIFIRHLVNLFLEGLILLFVKVFGSYKRIPESLISLLLLSFDLKLLLLFSMLIDFSEFLDILLNFFQLLSILQALRLTNLLPLLASFLTRISLLEYFWNLIISLTTWTCLLPKTGQLPLLLWHYGFVMLEFLLVPFQSWVYDVTQEWRNPFHLVVSPGFPPGFHIFFADWATLVLVEIKPDYATPAKYVEAMFDDYGILDCRNTNWTIKLIENWDIDCT